MSICLCGNSFSFAKACIRNSSIGVSAPRPGALRLFGKAQRRAFCDASHTWPSSGLKACADPSSVSRRRLSPLPKRIDRARDLTEEAFRLTIEKSREISVERPLSRKRIIPRIHGSGFQPLGHIKLCDNIDGLALHFTALGSGNQGDRKGRYLQNPVQLAARNGAR